MTVPGATAAPDGDRGHRPAHPHPVRGFGVKGTTGPDLVGELAAAAEGGGYRTFWTNDTPEGDGLALLAVAARGTSRIGLGVGVLPLDRWAPDEIAARIDSLGLPVERLTIGVGAGRPPGGTDRLRSGLERLRERTGARLVAGALGPRTRRVAAELADGILLDWVDPPTARAFAEEAGRDATAVGRQPPALMVYVFTALGRAASHRLQQERQYYASLPAYAAHIRRTGSSPSRASVEADTVDDLRRGLARFDGQLDEPILRAVVAAEDHPEGYLRLLRLAAPVPRPPL